MRGKEALVPNRIRKINGSFAFIEHDFLGRGFLEQLCHHEMVLYLFLVLVSNRIGLSWYSTFKICQVLHFSTDEYFRAREELVVKDLIAFDGIVFQVLSLPCPQRDDRWDSPPRSREAEGAVLCGVQDIARIADRLRCPKIHT
jgi:hypothetical protein